MSTRERAWTNLKHFPMFWLFVASYTAIHLAFEYNFYAVGGGAMFAKYGELGVDSQPISVAERVYYTKATWFFLLVWMQVLGARFKTALAWSFLIYALELIVLFPLRIYAALNVALAVGMVIEVVVRRREIAEE